MLDSDLSDLTVRQENPTFIRRGLEQTQDLCFDSVMRIEPSQSGTKPDMRSTLTRDGKSLKSFFFAATYTIDGASLFPMKMSVIPSWST